jgi:hypothetical protein
MRRGVERLKRRSFAKQCRGEKRRRGVERA